MSLQKTLDKCYALIQEVAQVTGQIEYSYSVNRLKRANIENWDWFWNNAITLSSKQIRLGPNWHTKDIVSKAAILIHESYHIKQYERGILTWTNYFFKKKEIEAAAETFEQIFRAHVVKTEKERGAPFK